MSDKVLSRLALVLSIMALLMLLATIPISYLGRSADLPPEFALWPADIIYLAAPAAFVLVGGLIAFNQPRNAYGWVMLANGIGQGSIQTFWISYGIYAFHVAAQPLPLASLAFFVIPIGWMLWVSTIPLLLILYPTGHLPSARWKPALWILAIGFVIAGGLGWLIDTSVGWIAKANPYRLTGSAGQVVEALLVIVVVIAVLVLFASVVSLIARFMRSTGIERQQYKWFAYAGTLLVFELIIDFFWEPNYPWEALKEMIPLVLLAIAIGIAVLRYRLFDIDVIIRKTLVYGLLTVALALVYFGLITLLQSLSTSVLGLQSPVTIVLSTLAIAALFNPLHNRIQNAIDRRFYRKKYNAEQAMAQFAVAARNETDIECLNTALLEVVQETMQPERVSIWLRSAKSKR